MVHAELMLLGFISLMLGVFQGATQKICVKESVMRHLLPCPLPSAGHAGAKYGASVFNGGARRLLSGGGAADDYCLRKVFALVYWPEYKVQAIHLLEHTLHGGRVCTVVPGPKPWTTMLLAS
jgi:mlo protein